MLEIGNVFVAKRHGGASGKSTGVFAKAHRACILGGSSGLLSKGGMAATFLQQTFMIAHVLGHF